VASTAWRAARLDDLAVMRAEGPDAASFLHGQLTQDVLGLAGSTARPAGYCSAKGRLLASLVVWRPAPEEVLAVCSADLVAPTVKRLSMFVLRARCKLAEATSRWAVWGAWGPGLATVVPPLAPWSVVALAAPDDGWIVAVPGPDATPRAMVVAASGRTPSILSEATAASSDDWFRDDVLAGLPRITAATVEQFVPQMVNLELVGGVNFQKGCYPGQEVVARSQYRGTVKRRAAVFIADAAARPATELFHDGDPGQPSGMVVNAAPSSPRHVVLAEVKLAAWAAPGAWHLGAPDGPVLERGTLPYAWPADPEGGIAVA
jgi:folate-binding protein YgfZ